MNISFIPGDLHLSKTDSGVFVVRLGDKVVLSTKSQRSALARFNALKSELEKKFPTHEPSTEEKVQLLKREINDSLLGHNSLGGRKKKSTAGGTRTFGG